MGGDELNILRLGSNYGWPVITHGLDYDGTPVSLLTHKDGLEQPIKYWKRSGKTRHSQGPWCFRKSNG
jgi:glucose/arabinose dehydrogenase